NGVLLPFSVDSGPQGRPKNAHITIVRAEANVPVDDALFRFPASGTKILRAVAASAGPAPAAHAAAPKPRAAAAAPVVDAGILSGLGARNIGSATMSGRIAAVAARNEGGKTTVFIGAASGGVWKSIDGGTTFKPVFDKQRVQSIGAITIDPTNPKVVWVG